MKNMTLILAICIACFTSHAQIKSLPEKYDIKPYFTGIIVSNIDTSLYWYQLVLGLTLKRAMNDSAHGYKIFELESENIFIELQETNKSVSPKAILENQARGTEIQGYFKVGFKVSDMNKFLAHLTALKISEPNIATDPTTNKRNFLISDPDGNWIQIYE